MPRGLTRREVGKAALAGVALAGIGGLAACGSDSDSGSGDRRSVLDSLPASRIPSPTDYVRTSWSRDPLARCSYSYLAPTPYGTGIREMLAEPFGRVAIAGEATSRTDPATVHGAIEAGRTAAGRVIEELPDGSRVAIVGAGACGLACAGALADAGYEAVILEAADRVGGRVRSADLAGSPVELGASWIHGTEGNPLSRLAEESGIGRRGYLYDWNFPVPAQQAIGEAGEARFWRSVDAFDPRVPGAREKTVDWLLPRKWGLGLEWSVQVEVPQEYGADPDRLAALATWEGGRFGGEDALLDGPYIDVISGLSGDAEIRLGFEVERVVQAGGEVTLSNVDEEVKADAAIVTVPIGVLKAGKIRFEPEPPARTRIAVEGLGAGLLDKLWLAFDKPFWEERAEGFQWIDPKVPGRWGFWVNSVPVDGRPFLMTLSGASDARLLAGRSDAEVLTGAMIALETMFA